VPRPAIDEALVRVRLAGICGTDLELLKGYYPYAGIPGHEFVGEVVESKNWRLLGQRVVGEINIPCGRCRLCSRSRPTHCERRAVLGIQNHHGAFAEYLALPSANLHRVPASVPDEAAVFTEPLAAALQIQKQVDIQPEDRVLLIGAGRLGQLIAQTLVLTGCDLRVLARHPLQRTRLAERNISCIEPDEVIPRSFDIVIEATGAPQGFEQARQAVIPRGTIVLKSTYHGTLQVDCSSLVVDEITLIGSRCGPFDAALLQLAQKTVDPTGLIAGRYPLSRAIEAFEQAQKAGVLKVLLAP
jgi:2-desacetyl-2-hydroxyethyl bacteriochlorophyllide A dehydrogenase